MIKNHFKIAWRNLWRSRWFSLINISGLGVGLTAGFLIFLYVSFQLSYDGFHEKGDRIYRVVADLKTPSEVKRKDRPAMAVPPALERQFPEVESAVRVQDLNLVVKKGNLKFDETSVISADPAFFQVFDFELLQGNPSTVLKEPYSLVLSQSSAKKYFGTEDPVGQTLQIVDEGFSVEVTGVMEDIPSNSHIKGDMVLSMNTFTSLNPNMDQEWSNYNAAAYILLKPNVDQEKFESKLPNFLERNSGEQMRQSQMVATLYLEQFEDVYLYSGRGGTGGIGIMNLYVFSLVAFIIILIACINFINLTTARSIERAKEVGIRKVIGAQKQQLALQFIGESVLTCIFAFFLTLFLSALLLPAFNNLVGEVIIQNIFASPRDIILLLVMTTGMGFLAGIYPALVLSSFRPVEILKGRFATGNRGAFLRKTLVVGQFTVSIGLIIGTLVIYYQMNYMRSQDLGFTHDQIMVLRVNKSQEALKQSMGQIHDIKSVSYSSSVPGGGYSSAYSKIENSQGDLQIANPVIYSVDFNYIPLFGLKILAGRGFSTDFATDTAEAMVINEKTVQLLGFSSPEEAVGKKFKQWGHEGRIIGVVQDFHFSSLKQEIKPLTMRIDPDRYHLLALKLDSENIQNTMASIKTEWNKFKPQQPFNYFFLDEYFDRQYRAEERFGNLVLYFSILAILISCLGLFGLASYSTLQRKREIGIRKIVGASVAGIVHLLSYEFLKLVLIGFVIASPLAWLLMNYWLREFAYRIEIQWWIFALAGVVAISIALLTVSFQAIKAAIANPVKSLRTE